MKSFNEFSEGLKKARKNVGADKCWDGYKAKGTKKKDGKEVPNCVKEDSKYGYDKKGNSLNPKDKNKKKKPKRWWDDNGNGIGYEEGEVSEGKDGLWDNIRQKKARMKSGSGEKKAKPGDKNYPKTLDIDEGAWQRKEGKNPSGGLNEKGRKSYERENPGSDLKRPQPEGGPRKKSFCARMSGVKGPMKKPNGDPTRKALALRKWKCRSKS